MEKEKKYLLLGGVEENKYVSKRDKKRGNKIIGLSNEKSVADENDYTDDFIDDLNLINEIEQEKAINNQEIKLKKNELKNLELEQELLNKQKKGIKKLQNIFNRQNSFLSKINLKRKNLPDLSSDNEDTEPIGKKVNQLDDSIKNQIRADILYGSDDEYEQKYNAEQKAKKNAIYKPDSNAETIEFDLNKYYPDITFGRKYYQFKKDMESMYDYSKILSPAYNYNPLKHQKFNMTFPLLYTAKNAKVVDPPPPKEYPHIINKIGIEHIDMPAIKSKASKIKGEEAAEHLLMSKSGSYMNTDFARKHLIFNNYLEVNSELQPYLKNKISKQIGEDKLLTTKGIYIDAESESSKKLAKALVNHMDFLNIVIANKIPLKNGIHVNSSMSFLDKNFHNAFNKADILDLHINKNGELEMLIGDTYDFNENESSDLVRQARKLQEKGEIIPYFILYHVIIPNNIKI